MEIANGVLLRCQRCQFVEVSGKQTEAADFGGDVFTDGPGQTEAIVRGRASAELVDYDERVLSGRAGGTSVDDKGTACVSLLFSVNKLACHFLPQNGGRLQHL